MSSRRLWWHLIEDVNHPEHNDMLEWIGGEFDPEEFDIESTNKKLKRIK
jgi:hypothetical protein